MDKNIFKNIDVNLTLLDKIIHPQKIEISGASNVGSTALSLYISDKFDEAGFTTMFIDISRKLTKWYLLQNGYHRYLYIAQINKTNDIYDIFDKNKEHIDLFIFDDLASISTEERYKNRHKELIMNLINYLNRESVNNSLLFINQMRMNMNNQVYFPYGYLIDCDLRVQLKILEKRTNYKIIQGYITKNNFGKEKYFSFKLYQDRLEGNVK